MKVGGIETSIQEIRSLQGFLPDSPGAQLLASIAFKVTQESDEAVRSPQNSLEVIRYHQGILRGIDLFQEMVREFLAMNVDVMKDEMDYDAEERDGEIEEVVDVGF